MQTCEIGESLFPYFYFEENYLHFSPSLARVFKNINATLLFIAILNVHNNYISNGDPVFIEVEGEFWFPISQTDVEYWTALTRNQSPTAMEHLKKLGLLKTRRLCLPSKRYISLIRDNIVPILTTLEDF
jgi:hypothetical protein